MPDWSYQPLFRPILFRLPAEQARDRTLGALGALAALPFGPRIIEFMGHMQPPSGLQRTAWGITFPTPLGLSAGLDAHGVALPALARFGFGFVEVGPIGEAPLVAGEPIRRCVDEQALWYPEPPSNDGADALAARLARIAPLPVPLGIRLGHALGAGPREAAHERGRVIAQLARHADFFTLDALPEQTAWSPAAWREHFAAVVEAGEHAGVPRPLLVCLRPDVGPARANHIIDAALAHGITGVVVGGGVRARDGGRLTGAPARAPSLALVRSLRQHWGTQVTIMAAGGVHEPADALCMIQAGASFVQVCSGLVYAGPGLPKRINEALSYVDAEPVAHADSAQAVRHRPIRTGWGWFGLLGCGMVLGGILAWIVAATRIILPYDEAFVGLRRGALAAINPRLLPFMAHDRVTLAGTMISIGALYLQLAGWGVRRGVHWARRILVVSGALGFASFFLFLGFGYFDPLHALVTVLLLPFFVLGIRGRAGASPIVSAPDLHNDARWRAGLWGQLIFVGLGFGLTLAGIAIAMIGITTVFVPDDLAFLRTTRDALLAINPRLVALIAHDRAGFGGALAANGVGVLLLALWGIRRGARWVWWTLLGAGIPGFASALSIHATVEYTTPAHVAPAVLAALVYLLGLLLLYPYLAHQGSMQEQATLLGGELARRRSPGSSA